MASSQQGQVELLGIARPCNLLSWTISVPHATALPSADSSHTVAEHQIFQDCSQSEYDDETAQPVPVSCEQGRLLTASFTAGAQQLLLCFPDSWHLLQRSKDGGLAYEAYTAGGPCISVPQAPLSAQPADISSTHQHHLAAAVVAVAAAASAPVQPAWQGGLLHAPAHSQQPVVVLWDTAGSLSSFPLDQPPARPCMRMSSAWESTACSLVSLSDGSLVAVARQLAVGQSQAAGGSQEAPAAVLIDMGKDSIADDGLQCLSSSVLLPEQQAVAVQHPGVDAGCGQCAASLLISLEDCHLLAQVGHHRLLASYACKAQRSGHCTQAQVLG